MSDARQDAGGTHPLWVRCPTCDEFWCSAHRQHACDCPCPAIDEMLFDPYTTGGVPLAQTDWDAIWDRV